MNSDDKEYVLLIDGTPSRQRVGGYIKTYQSRGSAERQARIEMRNDEESNRRRAKWNAEGIHVAKYPLLPKKTYATAKFSAIEIEEVKEDEQR